MKQQRRLDMFFYGLADFLTAMLAWACFYVYRKKVEGAPVDATIFQDENNMNYFLNFLVMKSKVIVF